MSKLSQLKQDAYLAGKKRDWETAVSIYERILELDKANPTLVNELGDLCLKTEDVRSAVRHFLNAAAKYRTNGLLNNAVAIYKKILRYDASNLNAHWYLSKTRAAQGLHVEGEVHGLEFLESSSKVTGDIKEIFLKRCVKLFELYSNSTPIMEHLLQIFRMWEMQLEASRVSCILACQFWDSGDEDRARESMEKVVAQFPEITKYPEHSQWLDRINPRINGAGAGYSDVNALDLGGSPDLVEQVDPFVAADPDPDPEPDSFADVSLEDPPVPEVELPVAETSFGDVSPDETDSFAAEDPVVIKDPEQDDDGCFSLDTDADVSFDDLISNATAQIPVAAESETSHFEDPLADSAFDDPISEPKVESDVSSDNEPQVDLLAQILADDSDSLAPQDSTQVATITEEIGAKVGAGGEGDGGSLYEMGLVYLEMDMFDQACDSFEKAACHPEYAIRAHEMWGITLLRSGKIDEAVVVLIAGLDLPEEGSRQQFGMLYHLGRAHEQAERFEDAEHCYNQINDKDRTFLDVRKRLSELSKV